MFSGFTNALAVSIYIYYARFKSYGLKAKIGDFLNGKLVILEIGVGGGSKNHPIWLKFSVGPENT